MEYLIIGRFFNRKEDLMRDDHSDVTIYPKPNSHTSPVHWFFILMTASPSDLDCIFDVPITHGLDCENHRIDPHAELIAALDPGTQPNWRQ